MTSPYSPTDKRADSPLFDFSAPNEDLGEAEFLDNVDLDAPSPNPAKDGQDSWRGSTSSSSFKYASASTASSSRPPLSTKSSAMSTNTVSTLLTAGGPTPLVLGVAVVDFNHLIGPTVEFSYPPSLTLAIQDDEEWMRLLPFLALPDGAHLSEEDYSYFHCTYSPSGGQVPTDVPSSQTLFGISCNRQLASSELTRRPSDVTRSTVQKAVVVIASQPVFGPIRDKLGVVTRAYFAQRDFTQTEILEDFYTSLESSLEGKSNEGAIYIGTSLRELIHKFRHKTLILLKLLMLQKKVMLYGYPVEKLCTYQYSLVSLIPGLLMSLKDCGAPDLDVKKTRVRPTSLRTSDRSSLLRYMGLPLQVFGKDSFFQPYMPLQQIHMLQAKSWLIGTTNQIVTQQKDCKYDLLVNIDTNTFEFTDPKLERIVTLTPSDRKWMDDVVRTVEETWSMSEGERPGFRGSDDDLRSRFEEYICATLSSIKYAEFLTKAKRQDISIVGVGGPAGDGAILAPFSEQWISTFKSTQAYEIWSGCTDPALFDICEPRHPCDGKVNAVSDLGLRLAEGFHDLHLDQQLGPTKEALSSAFAAGSSSIFKAFDGVRSEVNTRLQQREENHAQAKSALGSGNNTPPTTKNPQAGKQIEDIKATLGGIGSGIGSFFGSKISGFRAPPSGSANASSSANPTVRGIAREDGAVKGGLRPMSLMGSSNSSGSCYSRERCLLHVREHEMYPIASGRQGDIYAIRSSPNKRCDAGTCKIDHRHVISDTRLSNRIDSRDGGGIDEYGGLESWQVVKIVHAPRNGRANGNEPHDVLKEMKLLKTMNHPNIAPLLSYEYDQSKIQHSLTLPLYPISLSTILEDPLFPFNSPTLIHDKVIDLPKRISYQLLSAISYIHIFYPPTAHRDLNPSNVMFDWKGDVKLIDFGTAFSVCPPSPNTHASIEESDEVGEEDLDEDQNEFNLVGTDGEWFEDEGSMCCDVGTGSYRAPELLFSPTSYDPLFVDLWSVGCMIAHLFRTYGPSSISSDGSSISIASSDGSSDHEYESGSNDDYDPLDGPSSPFRSEKESSSRKPLFNATFGSLGLAASIFKVLGTPTPHNWPEFYLLPDAGKIGFPFSPPTNLLDHLPELANRENFRDILEVIERLLVLDPIKRISASQALELRWFKDIQQSNDPQQSIDPGNGIGNWLDKAKERYDFLAKKSFCE
ncbi:uncharacterized protein IL334_006970 [Kwoniella shivajii]|uniref:Protein kinase domain-containing protein n=1 Tax=Kwoniella shivajii TaxID=564305 RepID=A0ABZ1D8Q8_9TREE|nr:hypothetical protein IL334_006970 [Kwoniella shivajii]